VKFQEQGLFVLPPLPYTKNFQPFLLHVGRGEEHDPTALAAPFKSRTSCYVYIGRIGLCRVGLLSLAIEKS
jgi:hypothetical protein